MSQSNTMTLLPFVAAADLSANQYEMVVISADNTVALGSGAAGALMVGVLQNAPLIGEAALVAIAGQCKIKLGATVAGSAEVMVDAVAKGITATATNTILGICTEGGAVNEIGSMIFQPAGVKA